MTKRYLRDRYSTEGTLLSAAIERDRRILDALGNIGVAGNLHHLVSEIPDQFEDFYTVLIDSRDVVSFELSKVGPAVPKNVHRSSAASYREELGQGKTRIRFDRLLEAAKRGANP
ncbi:MAG TPA: hypothetical protein VGV39_22000 [Mesorhizobium sp.]|uniref:hypothetical protein n=1 Tax=Mesorhizobium sp. TaxID=1871066 RepID=UPI002DDD4D14|nr:hypothetical protein [Mesorhizobium sp.]HEV2505767.1 hypothetical protein [Mesorhizobium sp.]